MKTRHPAVAGMFYSGDKNTLEREVAVYLENSPQVDFVSQIFGLVSPHAGYMYSGGVAARGYRQLFDRDYDTVVVISPSHRIYFEEISIYNGDYYETPLGKIAIDKEIAKLLTEQNQQIIFSELGHSGDEHALEVQLPFLQQVFIDFKLVPIVISDQEKLNIDILANALAEVLKDRKALIVASSDLSHYHHYDKAVMLDQVAVDRINGFKEDELYEDVHSGLTEMCGAGPVITMMKACRLLGAKKSKVLLYRNSGDVIGDRSQVVGYLSAIVYS